MAEGPLGTLSREHFRLVVDPGVAVLDIQRMNLDGGSRLVEPQPHHHPFGPAVPGTEYEVADAVEDRAVPVDLERLNDMRVMADHGVRTAIDREACFRAVLGGGLTLVRNTPMERDDDAIHLLSQTTDVGSQRLGRIHRTAWASCGGRAAAGPV